MQEWIGHESFETTADITLVDRQQRYRI